MMHFRELRSGVDMAYAMRRAIKIDKLSKGKSAAHLTNDQVFKNSFVTVYDYDLKL